jgi:predicted acetyltransferase
MEQQITQQLKISAVPQSKKSILENLLHLYLHDFSEYAQIDDPYGLPDEQGRFVYDLFDSYWHEKNRIPLLVHINGNIVGFALLNEFSVKIQAQ